MLGPGRPCSVQAGPGPLQSFALEHQVLFTVRGSRPPSQGAGQLGREAATCSVG